MNDNQKDGIGGRIVLPAVLLVVTVIYLFEALRSLKPFEEGTAGPSFFPMVVSGVMIVALAAILWKAVRRTDGDGKVEAVALAEPVKVVVLTALYIALFKPIGYFISTSLYVLALLYVFRFQSRNMLTRVVWALVIAGGCFLLFSEVFQIRLPKLGEFI